MFPVLQLPEWLVDTLPVKPDLEFQKSLVDSSINGYYYIRLTDDVMDRDRNRDVQLSILPVGGFFCSQFQSVYQLHFPPDHAFWQKFHELWMTSCESSACDASLHTISWSDFERVASCKYSAAGIPVAAVCYHYDYAERLASWLEFTRALARWSQMLDDMLDWHDDRRDQRATYFLCEGERQRRAGESLEEWVVREGYSWGFDLLGQWMDALRSSAAELGSNDLQEYLSRRQTGLQRLQSVMRDGFAAISELAGLFQPAASSVEFGLGEECGVPTPVEAGQA